MAMLPNSDHRVRSQTLTAHGRSFHRIGNGRKTRGSEAGRYWTQARGLTAANAADPSPIVQRSTNTSTTSTHIEDRTITTPTG
ncbi:MAG: hypothetical protein R2711_10935, partial [Acidimicrobiales bacterium]